MPAPVIISVGPLSVADVVAVARHGARVELAEDSVAAMQLSRAYVEEMACSGRAVYGV